MAAVALATGIVTAALIAVSGAGIGVATAVWPDRVQQVYGSAQTQITRLSDQLAGTVPTATLGISGDLATVNLCDGTFTLMHSYARRGIPPVWAAHNDCGGDVVLPLRVGDLIDLVHAGHTTRYQVVDLRLTSKVWRPVSALEGLKGSLALQSCFFGGSDVPMKFVGLEPAR